MHRHLHEPKLPENCLEHFAGKNHLPFGLYLAILLFCYLTPTVLWSLNSEEISFPQPGVYISLCSAGHTAFHFPNHSS